MPQALEIRMIPAGPLETNAVLVIERESDSGLVIDTPPDSHDAIMAAIHEAGVKVETIVLTHTHWDHIVDANALRTSLGAKLVAHPRADAELANPGSKVMPLPFEIEVITPDAHLEEGDTMTLGNHAFDVRLLPGHDPSHIALISVEDRVMLGGDVLFPGGHGRTDLPSSDHNEMLHSLARLLDLPDDVTVYPGHGAPTTIGAERGWMEEMTKDVR